MTTRERTPASAGRRLWTTSSIAALGALLFGYDIGVVSGAQSFFAEEFGLDDAAVQIAVASVSVGAIIGAVLGGRFADRLGRRRALLWLGVLFGVGALATAVAPTFAIFLVVRVVVGLAVGRDPEVADPEIADIRGSLTEERGVRLREFRRPGLRACLGVAVVLGVAQQLSGANTVLFYTLRVLTDAGFFTQDTAILATAAVGAVNLAATILALLIVDRVGRKPLLVVGFTGMALSLGAEVAVFWGGNPDPAAALVFFLTFIGFFGVSISPVGWLLSSEIFPNRVRGLGSSVASSLNQAAGLVVSLTFLSLASTLGFSGAFGIYAVLGLVFLVFSLVAVPETKGRTLEEISAYWYAERTWPEDAPR